MKPTDERKQRGLPTPWATVLALAFTETTSYGVLYYSFAVFLKPMQADLGWSRSALTGAFSLALLLSGLAGLAVGFWLDRYGPRLLMTFGSCAATALVVAWSQVHSFAMFYLIWIALGLVMAMVHYEPAFWVVAQWFTQGRGRALTVLTFLAGFASVIYIPLAGWLIRVEGWRGALLILAAALGVCTIPVHALALRGKPPHSPTRAAPTVADAAAVALAVDEVLAGAHVASADADLAINLHDEPGVTRREALTSLTFWGLAAAFFLINLSTSALSVHLVPLLTDDGFSQPFATSIGGLLGVMSLPGRLIFLPLGDRFRRSWVTASIFLLHAVGLLLLLGSPGVGSVFAFVALFGMGFGAIMPARASLVAERYGPTYYGQINSVIAFAMTCARALGPLGMSLIYDHTGTYTLALVALIAAALLGAVALVLADSGAHGHRGHPARPGVRPA